MELHHQNDIKPPRLGIQLVDA
ncbi:uncharacterized protein G2W53_030637 [Senna tora]|uniref:Uncharacterized protein n=1 Tax=Senna tora TaxID=362788 RepID=A0A834T6E1_9FABA|nr:uncharacterized protein G2W53_030637 [Senna tora]